MKRALLVLETSTTIQSEDFSKHASLAHIF
jgi:hypothetical protein